MLLQNIADAALSGLTVDTDNVCLVLSSDIRWIDAADKEQSSASGVCALPQIIHALGDGILMGTGEGCKYKSSAVGASHIDCACRCSSRNSRRIFGISEKSSSGSTPWEYMFMANGYDIHVTGTLAVSKQGSLNTVCACKNSHLGIADAAAAVVVGMQGNDNVVSVFQVFAHILYLAGINVRHGVLHGDWAG